MVTTYRPLGAMSIPALVEHHEELCRAVEALTLLGNDVAAQDSDERAQDVQLEIMSRLSEVHDVSLVRLLKAIS